MNKPSFLRPVVLTCLCVLTLSACGYRGALYLPDQNKPDQTTPDSTVEQPSEEQP
ncbi:LPS translocon maturation chaperone LptM [Alteromonas facilis]|uniref:LPS translocon maturation chaperone LptM n=1 Tax=Alteromonas facilis TaxID=2048004 RepID=UPI003B82CDAE